ncbi:MAG: DUF2231 domain-containing protein [Candidatus Acidiferrales bacterium]
MRDLFPGLHSMLNLHPVFVHFPIALWVGALVFEIVAVARASEDWHRTAARTLYLGTLAAVLAVLTGWRAEMSVPPFGRARGVMSVHETLMLFATTIAGWLCIVALLKPRISGAAQKWFLAGLVVLVILVAIGADRGAEMVYRYATSVNLPAAAP